jgi:hypothetical protein
MATLWHRCVSARYRAVLGVWVGEGRCSRQSQCARHANTLVDLLQREIRATETTGASDIGVGGEPTLMRLTDGLRSLRSSTPLPGDACLSACIALLDDAPHYWLSARRTLALAQATLQEALLQAYSDQAMAHERAIMAKVVGYLEAIEHYLLVRYQGFPETPSEEEKRALLQHLGKGMDLLRRVSQKK